MKLCRYDDKFGLIRGDQLFDVTSAMGGLGEFIYPLPMYDPMIAALDKLRPLLEKAADAARPTALADVRLLSPVANPSKLICAPVNYADHLAEGTSDRAINFDRHVSKIHVAALFLKAVSAIAGPGEGIALRNLDRRNDHELELAVVIGKRADRIRIDQAFDHVAGYMIGLDITTRGVEDRSFRKSPDSYALLGPWFVSADEAGDVEALDMRLSVNGAVRQEANTRDLIVKIPELIAWASSCYALLPGDVLFTGTPAGVGPIVPGDVIDAQIERIGAMRVEVRAA